MTDKILHKTIYLNATPTQVWAYLTDPDLLAQWFHKPDAPLTQGATLNMYGADSGDLLIWGEVRTAREPEYLEYTFTIKPMGDAVSTVKWTLTPVEGGTQLSLTHDGLPQHAESFGLILSLDKGWEGHMDQMRTALHETHAA